MGAYCFGDRKIDEDDAGDTSLFLSLLEDSRPLKLWLPWHQQLARQRRLAVKRLKGRPLKLGPRELAIWHSKHSAPRCGGTCFNLFAREEMQPSAESILKLMSTSMVPVVLHVYAVGRSSSLQTLNTVTQDFLGKGGVFHGAIEVFGKEWSFGYTEQPVSGVFCCDPMQSDMHTYRESIYMGDCKKRPRIVEGILRQMRNKWLGSDYDLVRKNCCSFSNAFAKELGVGEIPRWVHSFADMGARIDDDIQRKLHMLAAVQDVLHGETDKVMEYLQADTDQQLSTSKGYDANHH